MDYSPDEKQINMTIGEKSIYKSRSIKGTLTNQNNISHHYTDFVAQKNR